MAFPLVYSCDGLPAVGARGVEFGSPAGDCHWRFAPHLTKMPPHVDRPNLVHLRADLDWLRRHAADAQPRSEYLERDALRRLVSNANRPNEAKCYLRGVRVLPVSAVSESVKRSDSVPRRCVPSLPSPQWIAFAEWSGRKAGESGNYFRRQSANCSQSDALAVSLPCSDASSARCQTNLAVQE